jgi:flagellar basal-body rod modification protein FlgD
VTAPLTGSSSSTTALTPAKGPVLGKDDFLKLLVTQLRNQDPLSPLDGAEFSAQLAQFSSVEQLIAIGSKLDGQAESIAQGALTTQTMLGTSLIGRDVTLRGATLGVAAGDTPRVAIELGAAAESVTVEVLGADGTPLGTQTFDGLGRGRATLTLDELDLPPGSYSYTVTALNGDSAPVAVESFMIGRVDGVSFAGGQVVLRIGGRLVPMLDIVEVVTPPQASSSSPSQETITP